MDSVTNKQEYLKSRVNQGTLDMNDKDLLHQVMINCNYLQDQETNFLPKNAH